MKATRRSISRSYSAGGHCMIQASEEALVQAVRRGIPRRAFTNESCQGYASGKRPRAHINRIVDWL